MLALNTLTPEQEMPYTTHFYGEFISGQSVSLAIDETDIGLLTYTIDNNLNAHIRAIFILPDYRGKGYGDFLTRSMMNLFTLSNMGVVIDYPDDNAYFSKFGFAATPQGLYVSPADIVFPSLCGNH